MKNLETRKAEFEAKAKAAKAAKIEEYKRRANCMNMTNAVMLRYSHLLREYLSDKDMDSLIKVNGEFNKKTSTAFKEIAEKVKEENPSWHCHYMTVNNSYGSPYIEVSSSYAHGEFGCIYYRISEGLGHQALEHKTDYEYVDFLLAEEELKEAEEEIRQAGYRKSRAKALLGK